jgi:hypothetical protein
MPEYRNLNIHCRQNLNSIFPSSVLGVCAPVCGSHPTDSLRVLHVLLSRAFDSIRRKSALDTVLIIPRGDMKQWVMEHLWSVRLQSVEGGHLSLRHHVQTGRVAHRFPVGKTRSGGFVPVATAAGNEANHSQKHVKARSGRWSQSFTSSFVFVRTADTRF